MCTICNIAGLITILIVPQQILLSNWGPNLERFEFLRHVLINRNCSLNFDIFFPLNFNSMLMLHHCSNHRNQKYSAR